MTRPTCGAPADSRETDETPSMGLAARAWGGDTTTSGSAASNHRPTETSTGLFFLVGWDETANQRSTGENVRLMLCDAKAMPLFSLTGNLAQPAAEKTG
jgi:hypothetical protein